MTLDELLAQLQLGQGDKDAARKQALMMAGLSMLGTRKGQEWDAVGRAGMGGIMEYNAAMAGAQQGKLDQFKMRDMAQKYLDGQNDREAQQQLAGQLGQVFNGGPQLQNMGAGGPTPANAQAAAPRSQAAQYREAAAIMAGRGQVEAAKKYADIAASLEEEYSTTPQPIRGADGKVTLTQFGKRGGTKDSGLTPAEKLHFANTGGMAGVGLDPFSGQQMSAGLPVSVSPDSQLSANVTMRGQNMTDARARDLNAISQGNAGTAKTGELRKEFNALPQVKAYGEVQPVLQSAREAVSVDTAAADLNLIYAAAKIMDPTSVVRESETAMVVNSASPAQKYVGQFNYVTGGGRLTPATRKALMAEVESRGRGYESGYKAARKAYETIADKQGVPKDQVFIEPFAGGAPAGVTPEAIQAELRRRGLVK